MDVPAEVDMLAAQIDGALARFNGLPEEVRLSIPGERVGQGLQKAKFHCAPLVEQERKEEQRERADWAASGIGGG